jgi:hypothetical protein
MCLSAARRSIRPQWVVADVSMIGNLQLGRLSLTLQKDDNCPTDIEDAITFLRLHGSSIIDTIKFLKAERSLSLDEAKRRVHTSPAWADLRADHDRLHDVIEAAAQDDDIWLP